MKLRLWYKLSVIFISFTALLLLCAYFLFPDLRQSFFIVLGLAFLLLIPLIFLISRLISNPILEISRVIYALAGGNFPHKILIPAHDEIGELANALNHMSDQIKARMAEMEVEKSRLQAVLFSMFEGVLVVDQTENILLMNQTLRDIFLISSDPVGRKPLEIIRNVEVQEIISQTLKLRQGGMQSREVVILLPEERIFSINATPVVRNGNTEGVVLVFHDITKLRQLENIRREFVANVSHELRTPMASIKGYAETLLEGALDDKNNAKDFIKIIYDDSDRLAKLIEDLLDLSRIESEKFKINVKPVEIVPIVKKVMAGLNRQFQAKSLKVDIQILNNVPMLLADADMLSQVFFNLIDNAIKYTDSKGKITLSASVHDGFVRIDIADTGMGIPEEDLPRIFERFYRVDKARSRELGGTGLGLSIVKHIVQAHGGEVFVESTVGEGSKFSFTIPSA